MLAPLEPFKEKVIQMRGIGNVSANYDKGTGSDGHWPPKMNALTCKSSVAHGVYGGPSIDQEIAKHIGGTTKLRSLSLGVQMGIGAGASAISAIAEGPKQTVQPKNNPAEVFDLAFRGLGASGEDPLVKLARARRHSVLDAVKVEYERLRKQLGASDKLRVDAHLNSIREVERSIDVQVTGACAAPDISKAPAAADRRTEDFLPTGYTQIDLLATALACDLTRVGSIQWGGNGVYAPWLGSGFNANHHDHSHGDNGTPTSGYVKIQNWYAGHLARLAGKLDAIPEGDGTTMLDNTAILWATEIGNGNHGRCSLPFVVVGSAGGALKTGRFLDFRIAEKQGKEDFANNNPIGMPHNLLMVALLNAMGIPATSFGDLQYTQGPLPYMLA